MKFQIKWLLLLVVTSVGNPLRAQESLDLNFGVSASKSVLGASYTHGKNQVNVGLHGLAYSGRDGFLIQPGVAYNRYITKNGFYASLIYNVVYLTRDVRSLSYDAGTGEFFYVTTAEKGWHSGLVMTGLGKSWQFIRWGLHADAGVATRTTSDFGKEWGIYFGGAVSYRFKLGD